MFEATIKKNLAQSHVCLLVLVRIHAVSLNFRDVMIANNQYFGQVIKDCVPGCDAVGEVAAIGDGVSQWNIKDRVAPTFFLGDTGAGITAENAGTSIPSESVPTGTLLQYRVYPATSLLRVPDNLSWEEAATLPCAGTWIWILELSFKQKR